MGSRSARVAERVTSTGPAPVGCATEPMLTVVDELARYTVSGPPSTCSKAVTPRVSWSMVRVTRSTTTAAPGVSGLNCAPSAVRAAWRKAP